MTQSNEQPEDRRLAAPAVGPEYAGSADPGVVSSVGEHAQAAGDVVDVLRAEHTKLKGVFGEVAQLVAADDRDALRLRWGGVVREVLEHVKAAQRVALPAAERVAGEGSMAEVRRRQDELMERLRRDDELTVDDVQPEQIRATLDAATEHFTTVDDVVVPLLTRLTGPERMRLGEDLRQVMG